MTFHKLVITKDKISDFSQNEENLYHFSVVILKQDFLNSLTHAHELLPLIPFLNLLVQA